MSDLITYPTSLRELVRGYYSEFPDAKVVHAASSLGLTPVQVQEARKALTRNGMIPLLKAATIRRKARSITARVETFYRENPWATHEEAAKALGLTPKQARNSRFRREVVRK